MNLLQSLPINTLVIFFVLSACQAKQEVIEVKNEKPNIIIILADDMGYGDISALNPNAKMSTPMLDELIEGGRNFSEAHTSAAYCTPTRYALLTGRYSFRTGLNGVVTGYSKPMIEYERETLASLLKKAGYHTAIVGKWHLGLEWQTKDPDQPLFTKDQWIPENLNVDYTKPVRGVGEIGFDYSFISPAGNNLAPFTFVKNGKVTTLPTEYVEPQIQGHTLRSRRNGGDIAPGYEFDQTLSIITEESMDFIRQHRDTDQPFFLYFSLTAPHFPWDPSPNFLGTSQAGEYGDFVQEIDYRVGQIVQTLKEIGKYENTLIIFTADNGGVAEPFFQQYDHEMNYGRRGQKGDIWEGGVRVPFIAHWPQEIPAGTSTDKPISLVDMLATFARITGQAFDSLYAEDSYDISTTLTGSDTAYNRGAIINQAGKAAALSITQDGWKLIPYGYGDSGLAPIPPGKPEKQLYNLNLDSLESKNVFESHTDRAKELFNLLERYKAQGYSR